MSNLIVTGSAGFVGSHLCGRTTAGRTADPLPRVVGLDLVAPASSPGYVSVQADITSSRQLQSAAVRFESETVIHLAAKAEVAIPFAELADMYLTNVTGTINVLSSFQPARFVLASSSAVYGNAGAAAPTWKDVCPLGAYGMSKAAAELACSQWAAQTGRTSVHLRLGNVIGRGCRGLIPHLVGHATTAPAGFRPARLRGGGRLVRDYVPVQFVARVLEIAAAIPLPSGSSRVFNVGSGRGMTNAQVAGHVQRMLRDRGYALEVEYSGPIELGEAEHVVLDTQDTTRSLDLAAPTHDDVMAAIEDAVQHCLEKTEHRPRAAALNV